MKKKAIEGQVQPVVMYDPVYNFAEKIAKTMDDLHSELTRVRSIAKTEIEKYRQVLEVIAKESECLGPGCPYCEREDGKHPYTGAAKLAQDVLKN